MEAFIHKLIPAIIIGLVAMNTIFIIVALSGCNGADAAESRHYQLWIDDKLICTGMYYYVSSGIYRFNCDDGSIVVGLHNAIIK